jgi:hypothetical protein
VSAVNKKKPRVFLFLFLFFSFLRFYFVFFFCLLLSHMSAKRSHELPDTPAKRTAVADGCGAPVPADILYERQMAPLPEELDTLAESSANCTAGEPVRKYVLVDTVSADSGTAKQVTVGDFDAIASVWILSGAEWDETMNTVQCKLAIARVLARELGPSGPCPSLQSFHRAMFFLAYSNRSRLCETDPVLWASRVHIAASVTGRCLPSVAALTCSWQDRLEGEAAAEFLRGCALARFSSSTPPAELSLSDCCEAIETLCMYPCEQYGEGKRYILRLLIAYGTAFFTDKSIHRIASALDHLTMLHRELVADDALVDAEAISRIYNGVMEKIAQITLTACQTDK